MTCWHDRTAPTQARALHLQSADRSNSSTTCPERAAAMLLKRSCPQGEEGQFPWEVPLTLKGTQFAPCRMMVASSRFKICGHDHFPLPCSVVAGSHMLRLCSLIGTFRHLTKPWAEVNAGVIASSLRIHATTHHSTR